MSPSKRSQNILPSVPSMNHAPHPKTQFLFTKQLALTIRGTDIQIFAALFRPSAMSLQTLVLVQQRKCLIWHLKSKACIWGWTGRLSIQLSVLSCVRMHNVQTQNWISIRDCAVVVQPEPSLAPHGREATYSLLLPWWSALVFPSPRCLGWPSSPPCLPLQLLPPQLVAPPLKSLTVLWSGATPLLTQGCGPPREGWAIPESPWCAALCPSVLMVQSPLSKATWELHSGTRPTHRGAAEAPCTPTEQRGVLPGNLRGRGAASYKVKMDKNIIPCKPPKVKGQLCSISSLHCEKTLILMTKRPVKTIRQKFC